MSQLFTVLGASGYIGSALSRHLQSLGYQVNLPARDSVISGGENMGRVIYCIGLTSDYAHKPFEAVKAHIEVLSRVLEFGEFISLVYLSSTRLYDGNVQGQEGSMLQLDPENPRHLYDLSKGAGEALCHHCGRKNVRVARLSNVYGGDNQGDNFIHQLVSLLKDNENIKVSNLPLVERDYIHIDDVCNALTEIALNGSYAVYNVASGKNVSNRELGSWMTQLSGCNINFISEVTPEVIGVSSPLINVSRLNELGVYPMPLKYGLAKLVQ